MKKIEKTLSAPIQDLNYELFKIQAFKSGATLENYCHVKYNYGYQYSTTPNTNTNMTRDITTAVKMIQALHGTCGVWYDKGTFYIESSHYESDYKTALITASRAEQLTIYEWHTGKYIDVPAVL